ncbi:MAG TPA: HEAT repeat domain-containing protein [Acidobacteriaceae bacterium]
MTTSCSTCKTFRLFLILLPGVSLMAAASMGSAQVAPLAPRWLAGTPPPPVETFADGLARHHVEPTEPSLIEALHDSDGEVRSLAAAQLAAMDDHPALPAITRALEDERDPQVQVNLAGAATWLGSRRAVDQLQQICQNVNVPSTARLDAARYVSHRELATCFPAIEQIERTDADPDVRVLALQAAVYYRGQESKAKALATAALPDLEPTVRIAAADALRSLHATGSIGALDRALQIEGDDTAREHLRETLRILRLPEEKH